MSTTQIGSALNTPADLRPVERLVLVLLADRTGPDGIAFPTVAQLAASANVTAATARRALRRLEELELIQRTASRTAAEATAPTAYRVIGDRT